MISKKHNRLIVIGDGIVYRYGKNHYVSGSSQLDFYECFEGIDEVIIWSRIYDISEADTKKYSMYDTSTSSKKITFCGIYNQRVGVKGYILTLIERIRKLNKLFKEPALVICAPISVSQWIMWFFFRKRDLIFISRVIGDPDGIADTFKPQFFWKAIVKFMKSIQKKYCKMAVLQTWVSHELEEKYSIANTPSVVFHDGLISDKQIVAHIKERDNLGLKLIFVGRLAPEKGLCNLIDAMYSLSNTNIQLIIVGEGVEEQHIKKQIADYHLEEQISLVGAKRWGKELFEIMRTADVLVLPSYNEGLGMVILEAMSNGLTVIASRVGGIPDIVVSEENGILCSPGSVSELAKAINRLYSNESLRADMCRKAIITAHENSRESQLTKFFSGYMKYVYKNL